MHAYSSFSTDQKVIPVVLVGLVQVILKWNGDYISYYQPRIYICHQKHWDSAYLRQGTSYECRRLANQYEWMSVNHFPYLPIVTNPESNTCIQTVIRIATKS